MNPPLITNEYDLGKINIAIIGNLTNDTIEPLKIAINEAHEMIKSEYIKTGHKIYVLFDMTNFTGNYDTEAFELMKSLAQGDTNFVEKTAIFGGQEKGAIVSEVVAALAGRDNIKVFDSKEDATAWLNG